MNDPKTISIEEAWKDRQFRDTYWDGYVDASFSDSDYIEFEATHSKYGKCKIKLERASDEAADKIIDRIFNGPKKRKWWQ